MYNHNQVNWFLAVWYVNSRVCEIFNNTNALSKFLSASDISDIIRVCIKSIQHYLIHQCVSRCQYVSNIQSQISATTIVVRNMNSSANWRILQKCISLYPVVFAYFLCTLVTFLRYLKIDDTVSSHFSVVIFLSLRFYFSLFILIPTQYQTPFRYNHYILTWNIIWNMIENK